MWKAFGQERHSARSYSEEIDPHYYRYILDYLLKDGLIEGVSIHEVPILGQRNTSQLRGLDDMRITPAGIAYLQENSIMKKAYETLKAMKHLFKQGNPPSPVQG